MVRNSPPPTIQSSAHGPQRRQRPRIAAMDSGPGPAVYCLPGTTGKINHDPSKRQNPAYSFGARTKQFSTISTSSASPGPVYYVSPSVNRNGKDGTPAYSLYGRSKTKGSTCSPGPAAYRAEKVNPLRESKAPAYSFGLKTGLLQMKSTTPSPNAYTLPSLVGSNIVGKRSNAAFSMTGRSKIGSFHEDLRKTPGPGTYKTVDPQVYGTRSAAYTLHIRGPLPSDNSKTPGPGAHSPEKVVISRQQTPAYSFGIKHSDYIAPYVNMQL